MATVYQSGKLIPIHNCKITGAVSVLLEDPNEIKGILGLCILAPQIPENPIESVFKAISDPKFDLTKWEKWLELLNGTKDSRLRDGLNPLSGLPNWNVGYYGTDSDIDFLVSELTSIFHAWNLQKTKNEKISLIISIADPEGDEKVEIESKDPAFVIYQGSIEYAIKFAGVFIRTTKIIFSIFSKADSVKQRNLVVALRERQKGKEGLVNLKNIEEVIDNQLIKELQGQKVIVIFLHGLLSTDLGTFDEIIKQLELLNNPKLSLYGYPHNTLAPIDSNAVDLANIIGTLFDGVIAPIPVIYFVCHSRGGLLARWTSVELYDRSEKYKTTIKQAITFGTPHEGSELAEKPDDLIALYVAYVFYKAEGFMPGFTELLQSLGEKSNYKGIEDLKRRDQNRGGFIDKLGVRERDQAKGDDKNRHLVIKAIGGIASDNDVLNKGYSTRKLKLSPKKVLNGIMDEENHDLVVRTESSLNTVIGLDIEAPWDCNHFQYFQESNAEKLKFVSLLIKKELEAAEKKLKKKDL